MSTTFVQTSNADHTWFHVDASDQVLGRLAVRIAKVLQGKNKPTYTPHEDCGDYVVVTNAKQLILTGNKATDKLYRYHTGYVGGLRELSYGQLREKDSERMLKLAVKRMLPKNRLSRRMMDKLKVYPGAEHPHVPQKPQPLPA